MRDFVEAAIRNKQMIEFTYGGGRRIVEPHVLGIERGRIGILGYQVDGYSSSGGLPEFRRFYLDEAGEPKALDQKFPGRRPFPSGRHSSWDTTLLIVDP